MADVLIVGWIAASALDSVQLADALRSSSTSRLTAAMLDLEALRPAAPRGRFARDESVKAWRELAAVLKLDVPDPAPRCAIVDCLTSATAPLSRCSRCRLAHCAWAVCKTLLTDADCSAAHQRAYVQSPCSLADLRSDWRRHRSICSTFAGP